MIDGVNAQSDFDWQQEPAFDAAVTLPNKAAIG